MLLGLARETVHDWFTPDGGAAANRRSPESARSYARPDGKVKVLGVLFLPALPDQLRLVEKALADLAFQVGDVRIQGRKAPLLIVDVPRRKHDLQGLV